MQGINQQVNKMTAICFTEWNNARWSSPVVIEITRDTIMTKGQVSVASSVLFYSFRDKAGNWTEPGELKLGINAGQPFVSFDGRYLFFTSIDGQRTGDIYWVSAKIIEELRPKE